MASAAIRVGLIGHTRSGNALGRLYSNWLALHDVGVEACVLVPAGGSMWGPVSGDSEFLASFVHSDAEMGGWASVLVAHKPWIGSLDRGVDLSRRHRLPLVLDVDDPDFENEVRTNPLLMATTLVVNPRRARRDARLIYLRRLTARRVDGVTVSNPALVPLYGPAEVVPHARRVRPAGRQHSERDHLSVAFVGTPRRHKGVQALREAVQNTKGALLTITAPPPPDALPRENWVGYTTLEAGLEIVDSADVVCIPSSDTAMARGQLPAKLIDAMMSGRAIVALPA